jgi:diadenosine tetraphosphate (Ap4A) HIT family hydrolase
VTGEDAAACEFCRIASGDGEIGSTNPFIERDFDVVFETDGFVVFPDAAPLAPRHALVVPRGHVLSFARLAADRRREARDLVEHLARQMPAPSGYVPCVFEHGSTEADEVVGCGITHAHLHFLFLPSETFDGRDDVPHFDAYPDLQSAFRSLGRRDYYLLGRPWRRIHATVVEEAAELKCSMFLRKWLAERLDRPDLASYRRYQTGGPDDMLEEVHRTHHLLADAPPLQ